MAGTTEATMTRVESRDGTEIAVWTSGHGPPLVLVHGAVADHTRWRPLLPHLEPHVTVHAMDRRGRGASGDAPGYAIEREFEDVAAVVDAVADASGFAADLYGHPFGGLCAFGGATLTAGIGKLVLYEGWPPADARARELPPGVGGRLDALLAEGNRDGVVQLGDQRVEGGVVGQRPVHQHEWRPLALDPDGERRPVGRPDVEPAGHELGSPRNATSCPATTS